jgi:epoxyqueuosine reductase
MRFTHFWNQASNERIAQMLVRARELDRTRLRELAQDAGLELTGVSTAEPFGPELENVLVERIRDGRLNGLPWFTEERARFSVDPRNLHPTARSIVSVGVPYWNPAIQHPDDGVLRGRISRYAWGRDYHKTLKQRLRQLHGLIERETGRDVEARHLVDTARIVDRAAAARSGLGWYGKNTMILVPRHGSWVMLGELVLDVDIQPDIPLQPKCGRCTRCLDVCPTGALVDEYVLDTPKCISFLTIELRGSIPRDIRSKMRDWVFGCDMCQDICPYTGAAKPQQEPSFLPRSIDHAYPSLHWLLRMDEAEFRREFSGTAVMRAKWQGMARNAAVAIGNIGSDEDLTVLEETVATHPVPEVRGHAAWAMATINLAIAVDPLKRLRDRESAPEVIDEIDAAIGEYRETG